MRRAANPWQSYRQVATQTASPGQLVLMLFDGAIRFLDRALAGFEFDDPAEFNTAVNNNLIRAQDIIRELDHSLNMEAGGEFSTTMRRLYRYFDDQLIQSNLNKDAEGIRVVIRLLTTLRDSWAEMLAGRGIEAPEEKAVLTAA
jgi:flagellar secretion chaperone FliS